MKPPSSKEEHEETPWTSQQWQQRQNSTEVQNTESGIIRNGFLTLCLLRKSLQKWVSLHLHFWTIFVSMPSKDFALPLCSLSPSYFISQFVGVNFLGHCDFLGSCSCRSFGVCLISIPLCYTQFRNIWKLQIVTTQPGFEHSRIFQLPQLVTLPQGLKGSANTWRYCRSGFPI